MSAIFGALNLTDVADARRLVNQIGQQTVYEAVNQVLAAHSAALNLAMSLFVEEETTKFQETYLTSGGGGYLDRIGRFAPPAATKGVGRWGVAYPLERFGRSYGGDRVTLAYMDLQTLDRHLDTIMLQDINTTRRELIKAMINKEVWDFEDELNGPLEIMPLANGDATLYPPTPDVQDSVTENHYITSGYVVGSISEVNNPIPVIRRELDEHFGQSEDNVVFVPENATPYIEDLDDFEDTGDPRVNDPAQVTLNSLPQNMPGRVVGRANHVWIVEWVWLPANYLFGINPAAPRPLKRRVDPPETGLPSELTLVAEDEVYPLKAAFYEKNFGFGVGNRLNGVFMQLTASGTYTSPAAYQRVQEPA